MNNVVYLILLLVVTVFFLIRAEFSKNRRHIFIFKPLSTLILITIVIFSFYDSAGHSLYSKGILIALLFSFGGDMALMFQENQKAFAIGLRLFIVAHISYIVVFLLFGHFIYTQLIPAAVLFAIGLYVYSLMKNNLGSMRIPVILYIIIISLMVGSAFSISANPVFSKTQGVMIIGGAVLFYISDLILAGNRYWKSWKYHRISLAFYYSGQALLVLSTLYFL